MSSFSCPHFDVEKDYCLRLRTDCVPGRKGCVLPNTSVFLFPVEERVREKEESKGMEHPDKR
jgi:hypothetical protein